MEAKLAANDHKPTWHESSAFDLFRALWGEVHELRDTLNALTGDRSKPRHERCEDIISECCDVALYALFIADVIGGVSGYRDERGR